MSKRPKCHQFSTLNATVYKSCILAQNFEESLNYDSDLDKTIAVSMNLKKPIFCYLASYQLYDWEHKLIKHGFTQLETWTNANSDNDITTFWYPNSKHTYKPTLLQKNKKLTKPQHRNSCCCGLIQVDDHSNPKQFDLLSLIDKYFEISSDTTSCCLLEAITDNTKMVSHYISLNFIPSQKWKVNNQWFYRLLLPDTLATVQRILNQKFLF